MDCWIVIPAHNEEASVGDVIRRVPRDVHPQLTVKVLLVNDGSRDRTEQAAAQAGADAVLRFEKNRGLGAAVRDGLQWARRNGADVAVMIDGDGEYPPEQIPSLLQPLLRQEADYVMGSRFQGSIQGMRLHRRLGNYCFTLLQTVLLRRFISDGQSGMRAFSRSALTELEIIHDYNYAQVMTLNLVRKGFRMTEVPIDYRARTTGESFVKFKDYITQVLPAVAKEMSRRPVRPPVSQPRKPSVGVRKPSGVQTEHETNLSK